MSRYRKNINVGENEFSCSFTQLNYPDGMGYFIIVSDKNKNIYSLDMKQASRNEWKISKKNSLPDWLMGLEQELAGSVRELRSGIVNM